MVGAEKLIAQPLISDTYRAEQQKLHDENEHYGTCGAEYAPMVSNIIERMQISHLLDYGCGHNCSLAKALKVPHKVTYQAYDPGVARFSKPPFPAQMVACIDVLEHIEPELLENVLDDLARLTEGVLFASITTGPALKVLSDGRNAHLIQEPMQWWLPKLWDRFDIQTVQSVSEESFFVIGTAKLRLEAKSGEKIV